MDWSWYSDATLVVRQYWCEPQSLAANVITIPCGLKTGWNYTHSVISSMHRSCDWSFYGHIGGGMRTDARNRMMEEMRKVHGGCVPSLYLTTDEADAQKLSTAEYTARMCNTKIAPAPRGMGLETFRFSEALECGSIPIVDDGGKVFHKYMPGLHEHAIVTDTEWKKTINGEPLAEHITNLLRNPVNLERRRVAAQVWYRDYKRSLQSRIAEVIHSAKRPANM